MAETQLSPSARRLAGARRVIVKIGSALLVDPASGLLNRPWLDTLARDVASLRSRGQQVVIVSSGAIALGRRHAGLPDGRLKLEESQAAAAVGQIRLAHAWKEALEALGLSVAQVLLTFEDTEQRSRYLNARSTLNTLLQLGVVPVINENDTVATAEIRYGDNDRLAARVAQMLSADCAVLLSDVDGLYTANPAGRRDAVHVPEVSEIDSRIAAMAAGPGSALGSGGMTTKIEAARIAVGAGCHLCIASGSVDHPLRHVEQGGRCTWFIAHESPLAVRKQWIAGSLRPAGEFVIDEGAAIALGQGKSLLPAGVIGVRGTFERGDAVRVVDAGGAELGRGISAYSSADAGRVAGRRSAEIEAILGYRGRTALIHRDDLVMTRIQPAADADE
jgi:glutamate 5-kinase